MRRILLLTPVVLLVSAAVTQGASQQARRIGGCPPAQHHTLVAATSSAAVYRVKLTRDESQYRGCARGQRRAIYLGGNDERLSNATGGATNNVVLAGSMVADEKFDSGVGSSEWTVRVWDLKSGRILYRLPTGPAPRKGFVGDGETTAIVLKTNGAVAWIVDTLQDTNRYEVRAYDKSGARLLAIGSDVDAHSLALAGGTLFWSQAVSRSRRSWISPCGRRRRA